MAEMLSVEAGDETTKIRVITSSNAEARIGRSQHYLGIRGESADSRASNIETSRSALGRLLYDATPIFCEALLMNIVGDRLLCRRAVGLLAFAIGRQFWKLIRLSVVVVLALFEPVMRVTLTLGLLLGVLVAFVFECSGVGHRFAFLEMLGLSLCCGAALLLYYALIALLLE